MPKISAVIITKNEERNIGRCLDSLKGIVDEILVVDSFSEDRTREISEKAGAKFVEQQWMGYSATKNWANDQAEGPYILSLDADEALSSELRNSIEKVKGSMNGVYEFNRLTNYCGKWIRHSGWYPDRKVRLFPKGKARWEGEYVHETLKTDADQPKTHLTGDLYHYSYYQIREHIARANKYSDLAAQKIVDAGKGGLLFKCMVNPYFRFWKHYLLKGGFLDGFYGFVISVIASFEVFLKYAKAISLSIQSKKS